jgi:hypothetical protein
MSDIEIKETISEGSWPDAQELLYYAAEQMRSKNEEAMTDDDWQQLEDWQGLSDALALTECIIA